MARRNTDPRQKPMDFMLPVSDWVHPAELPDLRTSSGVLAIDLETRDDGLAMGRGSGWVYRAGHIAGVSIASERGVCYASLTHPDGPVHDPQRVSDWVRDHMDCGAHVAMHNAVYDLGWLTTEWGLRVPPRLHDTKVMAHSLDENRMRYDLDSVCVDFGIQGKDEELLRQAAEALGCDPKKDLWRMPARFVGPYAEQDAVATRELAMRLMPMIEAQDMVDSYQLEIDILELIMEMRRRGVRIDTQRAPEVRSRLLQRRNMYLSQISEKIMIGRPIEMEDINSPRFLRKIFDAESIPYSKTAIGNPSFKTEEIEKLDHWLPELIVGARKSHDAGEKFIGNYIQGFTHLGRIHSEANSTKTRTTRFAYSDPPLQQMPSRNPEIAGMIRGLFLPEPGQVWGALDYSQQEFRLMVHFAKICKMAGVDDAVQKYRSDPNTDFHDLAAELTKLPRRRAKDVNFAKAFGAGRDKFALMTGMAVEEAVAVMSQYDEELPFISRLSDFCSKRASARGHIRLLDGARCHFDRWEPRWVDWSKVRDAQAVNPDIKTHPCSIEEARERINDADHPWSGRLRRAMTHKAMNSLIQGSAARQTKLCMRECWREGIVPMLQMHDELDFSFDDPAQAARAQEIMVETVQLEVPVVVDAEFGSNWGNAKASGDYGATFSEAMELVG